MNDEGQPRPKYIFNKCGTNIYFFYSTEVWSITIHHHRILDELILFTQKFIHFPLKYFFYLNKVNFQRGLRVDCQESFYLWLLIWAIFIFRRLSLNIPKENEERNICLQGLWAEQSICTLSSNQIKTYLIKNFIMFEISQVFSWNISFHFRCYIKVYYEVDLGAHLYGRSVTDHSQKLGLPAIQGSKGLLTLI